MQMRGKFPYLGSLIWTHHCNCYFQWIEQCEKSLSNEPCKITVRDDLENGIQKYAELCRVISDKQSSIQEVIDCGRDLAAKAQSKEAYYIEGVDQLQSQWTKVTDLVEDRRQKLDSWNTSFAQYEEVRGATIRAKEDLDARIKAWSDDFYDLSLATEF